MLNKDTISVQLVSLDFFIHFKDQSDKTSKMKIPSTQNNESVVFNYNCMGRSLHQFFSTSFIHIGKLLLKTQDETTGSRECKMVCLPMKSSSSLFSALRITS